MLRQYNNDRTSILFDSEDYQKTLFWPFFGVFDFFQTKNGDMTKIHYLVASNLVFQQKGHF